MNSFVHLHVHSSYSPMQGIPSLEALCQAARARGADALALTDTNGLYGAIRFLQVARQAGLRPILGAEVSDDSLQRGATGTRPVQQGAPCAKRRAVLLVKTPEGYANLCRLLSAHHSDASFNLIERVAQYRQGLVVLSDNEQALTAWQRDSAEDLYVELTPGPSMAQALAFSRRAGLPPVATTRAHFIHPRDFALHRLLRAIALNTTLSRLPSEACCTPTQWLMPSLTLARYFPHAPEALANTRRIADTCLTDWELTRTIFPSFRQLSDEEAFTLLREKTYQGAMRRYGALRPEVTKRIEEELAIIRDKRYAHHFLIVEEIVRQAPRTCGRGSVAASIVSYCLAITHVDPIEHHLFFERFLNPGRRDPPDIDIDFPWDERDDVLQWILDRYGGERVAMVANQNELELRGALREVAKVYGIASTEISQVLPLIMRQKDFLWFESRPSPALWAERLSRSLRLKPPWPEIVHQAARIVGHFRHLSVHCGGIVIVPDEIRRYVPVERAAKGVPVIQWDKDQAEDAGLVKIDLLGNRSLAVIRDAIEAIHRNTGRRIEYDTWDAITDAATQDLIRRGDTIGCFYIESPATRLLLRKLWTGMPAERRAQANVFDSLVVVSSLVRPAGNPFIQEYIRRAHGGTWQPLHDKLKSLLKDTYGIMVYQEDVTKVAMAVAGFSVEEAEQLRKVLSKKHRERQLRDYREQFCRGALANGATPTAVEELWKMIMSFAGYSFCKPHSASYAQVSFKSAYLRAHYPAEFMAAVLSNQGGFYSTFAYLSEARRMGLTILPPDVNASEWAYTGCGRTIRMGLMQIKGLSRDFAQRLVDERISRGPFRSFQDFLLRAQPDQAQARALIQAGCCDFVAGELTRPAMLWRAYSFRPARSGQAGFCQNLPTPLPVPDEYSEAQQLRHERETLGLIISRHPLELYRECWQGVRHIQACDMPRHIGRRVTMIGWLITEKFVEAKDGSPMEFVTFEDLTALYDATIFPDTYRRFCQLLAPNRAYILHGVIEQNFGVATLTVDSLTGLDGRHGNRFLRGSPEGRGVDRARGMLKHGAETTAQAEPIGCGLPPGGSDAL